MIFFLGPVFKEKNALDFVRTKKSV